MGRCYIITLREFTCGRGRRLAVFGPVGWVERSDTLQCRRRVMMGFAALYPSYDRHTFAISRRGSPELCFDFTLLKERGRREDRVHAAPAVSCAKRTKKTHTSIQVQRRHPAFPAQWLYGLLRVLPGERLFCHRRPLRSVLLEELDASTAASGPHDFAVRNRPRSSVAAIASTASHRAFVTIASAPLAGWDGALMD